MTLSKSQIDREIRKKNRAEGTRARKAENRAKNRLDFFRADLKRKAANAPAGSIGSAIR